MAETKIKSAAIRDTKPTGKPSAAVIPDTWKGRETGARLVPPDKVKVPGTTPAPATSTTGKTVAAILFVLAWLALAFVPALRASSTFSVTNDTVYTKGVGIYLSNSVSSFTFGTITNLAPGTSNAFTYTTATGVFTTATNPASGVYGLAYLTPFAKITNPNGAKLSLINSNFTSVAGIGALTPSPASASVPGVSPNINAQTLGGIPLAGLLQAPIGTLFPMAYTNKPVHYSQTNYVAQNAFIDQWGVLVSAGNDATARPNDPTRPWKTFDAAVTNLTIDSFLFNGSALITNDTMMIVGPGNFTNYNICDVNHGFAVFGQGPQTLFIANNTSGELGSTPTLFELETNNCFFNFAISNAISGLCFGADSSAADNVLLSNIVMYSQQNAFFTSSRVNGNAYNITGYSQQQFMCMTENGMSPGDIFDIVNPTVFVIQGPNSGNSPQSEINAIEAFGGSGIDGPPDHVVVFGGSITMVFTNALLGFPIAGQGDTFVGTYINENGPNCADPAAILWNGVASPPNLGYWFESIAMTNGDGTPAWSMAAPIAGKSYAAILSNTNSGSSFLKSGFVTNILFNGAGWITANVIITNNQQCWLTNLSTHEVRIAGSILGGPGTNAFSLSLPAQYGNKIALTNIIGTPALTASWFDSNQ